MFSTAAARTLTDHPSALCFMTNQNGGRPRLGLGIRASLFAPFRASARTLLSTAQHSITGFWCRPLLRTSFFEALTFSASFAFAPEH